jgi:hypothetical protein
MVVSAVAVIAVAAAIVRKQYIGTIKLLIFTDLSD